MATKNVFADFEVAANKEAPGRRLRTADARDRSAAMVLWNSLTLSRQIRLQMALTGFNGASVRVQNLEKDLPKNEPTSNDNNERTEFLRELQDLMDGRTAYIGAIDRLILRRGALANPALAVAYLQRHRTEQYRLLLAEQTRHANLTAILAATAVPPAGATDDTEAPTEGEDPAAPLEDGDPAVPPQDRDGRPVRGDSSSPQQSDNGENGASASPDSLLLSPTVPYQEPEEDAGEGSDEGKRRTEGRLMDRWVQGMTLDPGSTGIPQVWVKRNSRNMITDRLVYKHCAPHIAADRPSLWEGGNPIEAIAMLRLKSRIGSDKIVKLRNWRLGSSYLNVGERNVQNLYLYMEYCGLGDLFNLYSAQYNRNRSYYPEPFVWSVFEDLVIAGILLERGDLDSIAVAPGWDLIVHRDIKPGNVFLGVNTSQSFQGYPTAKLGDFGAACFVANNDRRTYQERSDDSLGTPANKAPEQMHPRLMGDPNTIHGLTTKTNIWAIGNCLWSMITLEGEGDAKLDDGFTEDHKVPTAFSDEVKAFYSLTLLDLVMTLVQYLPKDRANLDDVLASIRKATRPGVNDLAQGLRIAPQDDAGFTTHALLTTPDKYALWAAFPDALPAAPESKKRKADEAFDGDSDGDAGSLSSEGGDDLGGDAGTMMLPEVIVDPIALVDAANRS